MKFSLPRIGLALALLAFSASVAQADPAIQEGKKMSAPIVFFDIAGPDGAKLKDFYAGIFGWNINANLGIKTPTLDGTLRQDPAEKIIYIGVPDINAALKEIEAKGGKTDTPRMVVPGVVTFALFRDPAGNRMGLVEVKP
jgi:predicted enzyme related to lactoylglutathione lyase